MAQRAVCLLSGTNTKWPRWSLRPDPHLLLLHIVIGYRRYAAPATLDEYKSSPTGVSKSFLYSTSRACLTENTHPLSIYEDNRQEQIVWFLYSVSGFVSNAMINHPGFFHCACLSFLLVEKLRENWMSARNVLRY